MNQVCSTVVATHEQQAKKTAALPKNTTVEPSGVIVYDHINLPCVKADSMKRIVCLLPNKEKFEPKLLSYVSQIIAKDRIIRFVLLYSAYLKII